MEDRISKFVDIELEHLGKPDENDTFDLQEWRLMLEQMRDAGGPECSCLKPACLFCQWERKYQDRFGSIS